MNNENMSPIVMVSVAVLTVLLVVVVGKDFVLNAIADRAVHRIMKEYSPSPYGPGVDPDKVDVLKLSQQASKVLVTQPTEKVPVKQDSWESNWELQRN